MAAPRTPSSVGLISLGCAKNRVDSEILLGELARRGHAITPDMESAETVIVNTCAFIDEAKRESIDAILEVAARKGKGVGKLLVAGCMVNRFGEELARDIPEIDGFISLDSLLDVETIVNLGGAAPPPSPSHMVFDHTAPRLLTTRGYAYLKVAEGCNNPCTFCAIPLWRGRFRSRTVESLVEEARGLEAQGVGELCLIAQDTTRYGEDLDYGKHGLTRLAEALLASTGFKWIRFLYAYPTTLDEQLLKLMGEEERLVSYVDMPLQHSHPDMLKAMRRGGSAERYTRLLERARELAPDIFLRTTFIVGFPGETDEHFDHLLDFVKRSRFDHLGAFVYSAGAGDAGGGARRSGAAGGRPPPPPPPARGAEADRPGAPQGARRPDLRRPGRGSLAGDRAPPRRAAPRHGAGDRRPAADQRRLGARPGPSPGVEITDAFASDLVGRIVGPVDTPGVEIAASVA